jgi:4-amino-4-deoxy-L-arabinose transferase-like glycosyltransferase
MLVEAEIMIDQTSSEPLVERVTPIPTDGPQRSTALLILSGLWLIIFFAALFAPPLLDDADATHANAARHMVLTGDLVTLHVNGIRYLEKAPLPYWLDALSFRIFGFNTFAAHLPQAIAVLLLALLGFHWADKAFRARTAFYTGLAVLTSAGVFLFTRIYIPEVWLSFFLCTALYCFLQALDIDLDSSYRKESVILSGGTRAAGSEVEGPVVAVARSLSNERLSPTFYAYAMWTALALAILTKGLIAPVFFFGTAIVYLALTGDYKKWRTLRPFTGLLLFFAIAAPWHILAGLRNTGGMNGHGFFWFYFINEHFLRFLGKRYPMDYNKLPGYLFWSLHIVWLFPWSLFAPLWVAQKDRQWRKFLRTHTYRPKMWIYYLTFILGGFLIDILGLANAITILLVWGIGIFFYQFHLGRRAFNESGFPLTDISIAQRTTLLLSIYAALILIFFSISTNQEYYTFPAYLPILILIAAGLTRAEDAYSEDKSSRRWLIFAHATFTVIGLAVAITLAIGLWTSRHLPFVPDIGELLAHRGVGDYTLSMSHLFDLTGPSFAALRLPAALAAFAFSIGPAIAWVLRAKRRHLAATTTVALTSAVFLIAAHIALVRFGPMLSSQNLAAKIQQLEATHAIAPDTTILLFGDQSYGSSIPFYLGKDVLLVDGRSSSMIFGSTFPDAPRIFLTHDDLLKVWGTGSRKILFVPLEKRDVVDQFLGNKILIQETSGKALFTDRPLDTPTSLTSR